MGKHTNQPLDTSSSRYIKLTNAINIMHSFLVKYWPIIIFALLPLAILAPILGRGYILQYDMVFTPHVNLSLEALRSGNMLHQAIPVTIILKLISYILPMDIVQKIILYAIFFLSAYSIYICLDLKSKTAKVVAGIFYSINPFTYDRLMAGHWLFLLAYALTPFVLLSFYKLFTNPNKKNLIIATLLWSSISLISPHHLFIFAILFLCMCIFFIRTKKTAIFGLITILGVIILSLWWILPLLLTNNFTHSFGLDQFYAFATKGDIQQGIWFNMLSLQGLWYTNWISIKELITFWPLIVILWLIPVFIGIGCIRAYNSTVIKLALSLLLASFIALFIAAGPSPEVSSINSWLYVHIPGISGMRESQKLLSILALMYAFFIAYGINYFIDKKQTILATIDIVLSIATIITMTLPIFWSAHNQLQLVQYPKSWEQFYEYISKEENNAKIIILPWNLYIDGTFTNKLVANPAKEYFGQWAIASENMNLPNVRSFESPENKKLLEALQNKDGLQLSNAMRDRGAKYIMLINSNDNSDYQWIANISGNFQLLNDGNIIVMLLTNN